MKKIQVPIKGMHCRSCEMLIEKNLSEVKGIAKTEVSHKEKGAVIYYESEAPDMGKVEEAVRQAGYDLGSDEKQGFFSKNRSDYHDLLVAFIAVILGFNVLKGLGLSDLGMNSASNPSSLSVVFLVGLTAGISTCMALVGGLVLGMSAKHAEKHPEASRSEKFRPHLFFNLGRIAGFAVLGGALGLVGSAFEISAGFSGLLIILVGILMLVLGLQLIDIFPWIKNFNFTLPKSLSRVLGLKEHDREYSHKKAVIMGALTFFLPCGFTQSMQVFALSSGSMMSGAMIMGLFALGTAPGLLGIGGLTSVVKGIFAKRFFKFAGIVVILLSIFNINNGIGLLGYEIAWSAPADNGKQTVVKDPNVTIVDGVQVVKMTQVGNGYKPNKFTIQKDMPVRWVIDSQAPYSCASALVMPKMKIRKFLEAGENIIEFTPTEAGKLAFSCSMGMYTGSFNVVDPKAGSKGPVSAAEAAGVEEEALPAHSCGGAEGSGGGGCGGSCGGSCSCGGGV